MKVGIKGKSEIRKRPAKRSHICYGNNKNNTILGNARLGSGLVNDPITPIIDEGHRGDLWV